MYLLITIIRNQLYKLGILKSKSYKDIFVLCVGNIRVGGTGKTPMIEYLIRHLKDEFRLSVVSLGYKRSTKGLKEVLVTDSAEAVGDEPKQMKCNFPDIPFFVCKDRNIAIDHIMHTYPNMQIVLLDDAFQYRKTKPSMSVLLTEYSRPFFKDKIIPYGRLRESKQQSKRADIIIVTKTPNSVTSQDKNKFIDSLNKTPEQSIFFAEIGYKPLPEEYKNTPLLFVAGIDNPYPAVEYLQQSGYDVVLKKYPDHHAFSDKDIAEIKYAASDTRRIVTTSKDAVRLQGKGISFAVLEIEDIIEKNFIQSVKQAVINHLK